MSTNLIFPGYIKNGKSPGNEYVKHVFVNCVECLSSLTTSFRVLATHTHDSVHYMYGFFSGV